MVNCFMLCVLGHIGHSSLLGIDYTVLTFELRNGCLIVYYLHPWRFYF